MIEPTLRIAPQDRGQSAKCAELEQLLHQHSTALLKYISAKFPGELRRYSEPKDILQDTFFVAFQRMIEFDAARPDSILPWLMTIAKNLMIDALRASNSKKRRNNRLEDANDADVIAILEEMAIYSRTPSKSAMSHEIALKVTESLSRIEPHYSEVLRLRFLEGLSVKESASRIGRSEAATSMLCNRALGSLRRNLRLLALVA